MAEKSQPSQSVEPVPRSFRITQDIIEKFGLTKGCPKCEALRRNDEHRTVHHSRECRTRLEVEMTKDTALSKKLSEIEERQKHYLARRVESSDRERVEGMSSGSKGEAGVPASVHGVGTPAEEADQTHACEQELSEGVSASVHRKKRTYPWISTSLWLNA